MQMRPSRPPVTVSSIAGVESPVWRLTKEKAGRQRKAGSPPSPGQRRVCSTAALEKVLRLLVGAF